MGEGLRYLVEQDSGVPGRVFLGETHVGVSRLESSRRAFLRWVGPLEAIEGLNRTKRQSKAGFALSACLPVGTSIFSCVWT